MCEKGVTFYWHSILYLFSQSEKSLYLHPVSSLLQCTYIFIKISSLEWCEMSIVEVKRLFITISFHVCAIQIPSSEEYFWMEFFHHKRMNFIFKRERKAWNFYDKIFPFQNHPQFNLLPLNSTNSRSSLLKMSIKYRFWRHFKKLLEKNHIMTHLFGFFTPTHSFFPFHRHIQHLHP